MGKFTSVDEELKFGNRNDARTPMEACGLDLWFADRGSGVHFWDLLKPDGVSLRLLRLELFKPKEDHFVKPEVAQRRRTERSINHPKTLQSFRISGVRSSLVMVSLIVSCQPLPAVEDD